MAEDTKIQRHSLHTEHHQNPDGHHALRDSALLFLGLHMTFANNLSTASEMQAADTHVAFQNASTAKSSTRFAAAPVDMVHPTVRVREIGHTEEWAEWRIFQDLTDRWGEVNWYDAAKKPIEQLEGNPELLAHLCAQMWDEVTFIVCKDGAFGVLFEVEFCSRESEFDSAKDRNMFETKWYKTLKPHAVVVNTLLDGLKKLAERFPGVQFGVPDESVIFENRPAIWAFVPDGLLSDAKRAELGRAICDL